MDRIVVALKPEEHQLIVDALELHHDLIEDRQLDVEALLYHLERAAGVEA